MTAALILVCVGAAVGLYIDHRRDEARRREARRRQARLGHLWRGHLWVADDDGWVWNRIGTGGEWVRR